MFGRKKATESVEPTHDDKPDPSFERLKADVVAGKHSRGILRSMFMHEALTAEQYEEVLRRMDFAEAEAAGKVTD